MPLKLEEIVFDLCSWCGRDLRAEQELIPLGAPFEFEEDELALIGEPIEFSSEGFVLTGVFFPLDAEEKAEGLDLGLFACSDDCADKAMECIGNREVKPRRLTEATVRLKMART